MTVDYSKKENWLKISNQEKNVDTFYLYPSSYLSDREDFKLFADINDEKMMKIAGKSLEIQGGVFERDTNVFAPLYRQADPIEGLRRKKTGEDQEVVEHLYAEAVNAFEYYLNNFSNGRPFILAGHSQGSSVLQLLLSQYFKDKPALCQRMVAAYLPGVFISSEFMNENPHLRFTENEEDTGVIVSWNTEKTDFEEKHPLMEGDDALVVNPITWKRDSQHATSEHNKGSLVKGKLVVPGIADAIINEKRGTIQCSTVNPDDYKQPMGIFKDGIYHSMDYGFYFLNIQENVGKRIDAYMDKFKVIRNND